MSPFLSRTSSRVRSPSRYHCLARTGPTDEIRDDPVWLERISLTDTVDLREQLSDHHVLCSFVFDSLQISGLDNLHDLRVGPD